MATTLAAQLAQQAAKSTNQLDLKAQKKAHSQSLLFKEQAASSQDFDTLYEICIEGFQELCQIDRRFQPFSRNIFGEQSKSEERGQMTTAQNEELDGVLEGFLSLVASRILLKPAQKAVEWLIRRFRIHELNTECTLFTFLPYHSLPIFANLLSIVPQTLPPIFRWLQPYVESTTCPPRQAILNTAIRDPAFVTKWSAYVLSACRRGHQYQALTSYWATITSDAITGQLDQNIAGRREARRQQEEDILLRILPIINDGLAIKKVQDIRVGCYMILMILTAKIDLEDKVLLTMMEAVVSGRNESISHAEIICLSVLAQRMRSTTLPTKVFKSIIRLPALEEDLMLLSQQYDVGSLCLGLSRRIIQEVQDDGVIPHLGLIMKAIDKKLLVGPQLSAAVSSILDSVDDDTNLFGTDTRIRLGSLIKRLVDTEETGIVRKAIENSSRDIEQLEVKLQTVLLPTGDQPLLTYDVDMDDAKDIAPGETYESLKAKIPTETFEASFLSHTRSYVFESLYYAFLMATKSREHLNDLSNLAILSKNVALSQPRYLSFHARVWCGPFPASARSAALISMKDFSRESKEPGDLQALLPYILYALADQSKAVRHAATDLLAAWGSFRTKFQNHPDAQQIHGKLNLYGEETKLDDTLWMSFSQANTIANIFFSQLEECRLDSSHVSRVITEIFNGKTDSKSDKGVKKDLNSSIRVAFLSFLASHITHTPLVSVKVRLLQELSKVGKVGSTSKSKLLAPVLDEFVDLSIEGLHEKCYTEDLEDSQVCADIASIVSPNDREGVKKLQQIITSPDDSTPSLLRVSLIRRLGSIWGSMKFDTQVSSADILLELACSSRGISIEALDTIREVPLSADVLKVLLEGLHSLMPEGRDSSPVVKRRRTSHGSVDGKQSENISDTISDALRKITIILELVEGSQNGQDPDLVNPLFRTLTDLYSIRNKATVDFTYTQVSLFNCLYQCVETARKSKVSIDGHAIRADLVVDCFRNTTNTQLQQAALLLMSSLAGLAPDLIVHSVMPIFTFMGNNMLRQADDYSAHVIEQTIESVIPPLINSFRKDKRGPIAGAAELLLSFVAAFDHIPTHRRLGLFQALVERLGVSDYLFALLVLLADRYGETKATVSFATDLCSKYSPLIQLSTIDQYVEVVLGSLEQKPTLTSQYLLSQENGRDKAATAAVLLLMPQQLLRSPHLTSAIKKVLAKNAESADEVRATYSRLVEQTLILSDLKHSEKSLSLSCNAFIDALSGVLSLNESIRALEHLIDDGSDFVKLQVLRSLDKRIKGVKLGSQDSREACLGFTPRLRSILSSPSDVSLKQTALACIGRVAEKFGKTSVDEMLLVAKDISGENGLSAPEIQLRIMSLFSLTTLVEVLGDAIVPIIPQAVPLALSHFEETVKEEAVDEGLYNAILSFFESLFHYVPWLITGSYLDRFIASSEASSSIEMSSECDEAREGTLNLMAKQINPQEFFSSLRRTWDNAVKEGPQAVEEHLMVLRVAIERHSKSTITKHSQQLAEIFIDILGLRAQVKGLQNDEFDDEELASLEETASDAIIKAIYKLNDRNFRPIFIQMLEWADGKSTKQTPKAAPLRQISLYGFLQKFFDTLKSIVTSYAGLILENSVDCLESISAADAQSSLLQKRILRSLGVAFDHDQDDFWQAPTRFGPISDALVIQLSKSAAENNNGALINCLTSLASAADSPENLKILNTGIMKHLRAESPSVRLLAVKCEISITEALGEEWLTLLPEMLPFISEAMEDDEEAVEVQVRNWARNIEAILGESLDSMLQ